MRTIATRREFVKTLPAGTAGLSLLPRPARAASKEAFAFPLLGDLHYDKLSCHDLELLGREKPDDLLSGVRDYTEDQVTVEPNFSPATEPQRRAVYQVEAPLVTQFQYADLSGYAVVRVNGPRVTAIVYSGVGRQAWRTLALSELLAS